MTPSEPSQIQADETAENPDAATSGTPEVRCVFAAPKALYFATDDYFSPTREFVAKAVYCSRTCTTTTVERKFCVIALLFLITLPTNNAEVLHCPGLIDSIKNYLQMALREANNIKSLAAAALSQQNKLDALASNPTGFKHDLFAALTKIATYWGIPTRSPSIADMDRYYTTNGNQGLDDGPSDSILWMPVCYTSTAFGLILENIILKPDIPPGDKEVVLSVLTALPDLLNAVLAISGIFEANTKTKRFHEVIPRILCLASKFRRTLPSIDLEDPQYQISDSMKQWMIRTWLHCGDKLEDCCLEDIAQVMRREDVSTASHHIHSTQISTEQDKNICPWITDTEVIDVLKKTLAGSGDLFIRFPLLIDITLGMLHRSSDLIQYVVNSKLHLDILDCLRKIRNARPNLSSAELLYLLIRVDLFFSDCYSLIKDHETRASFVSALSKVPVPNSALASEQLSVLFVFNILA